MPDNEHNVLIGNQGGQVGLYDIRKPKECIVKDSTGNYWIYFYPHDEYHEGLVTIVLHVCMYKH